MAHTAKGDFLTTRALIDKYQKIWNNSINKANAGFFATTPFFISYCDNAKEMRKAYYSYLLGFAYRFMGEEEKSKEMFKTVSRLDKINL